jgi:putative phosphoribosyl transferase
MRVALQAARKRNPARLVLATPVAAPDTIDRLRPLADEVVCVEMPADLGAIGFYYADFHQMSDEEVTAILARAAAPATAQTEPKASAGWRKFLARHLGKPDREPGPVPEDHSADR